VPFAADGHALPRIAFVPYRNVMRGGAVKGPRRLIVLFVGHG